MPGPDQLQRTHQSALEGPQEEEMGGMSFAPPAFSLTASTLPPPATPSAPSGGEAPIQRQVIQRQLRQATSTLESVSILQSLLRGENTSAMRSVARAIEQQLARATSSGGEIQVVCVGGGDQFNLTLSEEDARAMLTQLNTRVSHMEGLAEATSFDTTRTAPAEGTFGYAFNQHFASILPALRRAAPVIEGDVDPRNPFFTDEELAQMFTDGQRAKLTAYFAEPHMVPDHLFDNGDLGNANTAQRIEIASHILAHGQIQRGSFTQRMHARMCGHWVELVYNYAGAGITDARGIEFNFDHEGEATMGSGRLEGIFEGDRRDLTPEEVDPERPLRSFRRGAFPMERFPELRPGDWVYVFTNTNTAGGDHSGIFSHWVDTEPREDNGIRYQRAVIFSQRRPELGGTEDVWRLSDRDGTAGGGGLHTVSRIVRHSAGTEAPTTVADVESSDLGVRGGRHSSTISRANETFLRRQGRPGRPVNQQALVAYIQRVNGELLDQLEHTGRVTESELFLWRGTNQSQDLEVLVRLNERMNNLIMGATTLERTMTAESERVDPAREAAQATADIERERLEGDLRIVEADITRLDAAVAIGNEAEPLKAERSRLQREIDRLRTRQRRARTREDRTALRDQIQEKTRRRAELLTQIQEIEARRDRAIEESIAQEGNWRIGRPRSMRERRARLVRRRDTINGELLALDEAGGYHLSHPGRSSDFRGEETGRARMTGLVQNLRPAPSWDSLRQPAE